MSRMFMCIMAIILCSVLAAGVRLGAQDQQGSTTPPHYQVGILGTLGGTAGAANGINNRCWITGVYNLPGDLTTAATLWVQVQTIPLGTLSGGPNSAVAWPVKNNNGVIVGISELPDIDPVGNNFSCWPFLGTGNPSGRICKGFRLQNGQMTPLQPFPGGFSSYATGVNNLRQCVVWAGNW